MKPATSQTQVVFGGAFGRSYKFRVRAEDGVSNIGDWVKAGPMQLTLNAVKSSGVVIIVYALRHQATLAGDRAAIKINGKTQ